jgi:hypothetical protein
MSNAANEMTRQLLLEKNAASTFAGSKPDVGPTSRPMPRSPEAPHLATLSFEWEEQAPGSSTWSGLRSRYKLAKREILDAFFDVPRVVTKRVAHLMFTAREIQHLHDSVDAGQNRVYARNGTRRAGG